MAPTRAAVLAIACALACLGAGCGQGRVSSEASRTGNAGAATPIDLPVVAVSPGLDPGDIFLTFLEPEVDAPVIARRSGLVRVVMAHEGQRVAAGTTLARLEDDKQKLELERATAFHDQAEAELARAEKGVAGEFISRQTLDAARARAQAAHADEELARVEWERCALRAPVSGVVWQVRAEPHASVQESDILFRVTDPLRLRADLFLPASLLGSVHVGSPVRLIPTEAPAASAIEAVVRSVSPVVDPQTGRFRVELAAHASTGVPAGTPVRAEFAPSRTEGLPAGTSAAGAASGGRAGPHGAGAVLPNSAYLERDGATLYAFVVRGGRVRRVVVELGATEPDGYEVLSGVSPGELVATQGQLPPADGTAVSARVVQFGRR